MKETHKYNPHSSYNNNNFNEKVFYLPSDDKSFIKRTHNPFLEKKEEEKKNFPYFVNVGKSVIFKSGGRDLESLYNIIKGKIRYVICILMESDSYSNSGVLQRTLRSVINNITSFKEIHLEQKNILICIFFKDIKGKEIFNRKDYVYLKDINDYILVKKKYIYEEKDNKSIKIIAFQKLLILVKQKFLNAFIPL